MYAFKPNFSYNNFLVIKEIVKEDMKSHFEYIASQNVDLDKLANKLDYTARINETGRKHKTKTDKIRALINTWQESNESKANLNKLTKALGAMNKGDIAKKIGK